MTQAAEFDPFAPGDPIFDDKWDMARVWRKPSGAKLDKHVNFEGTTFRLTENLYNMLYWCAQSYPQRYKNVTDVMRTAIYNQAHIEREVAKEPSPEYDARLRAFDARVRWEIRQADFEEQAETVARMRHSMRQAGSRPDEQFDAVMECERMFATLTYERFVRQGRAILNGEAE